MLTMALNGHTNYAESSKDYNQRLSAREKKLFTATSLDSGITNESNGEWPCAPSHPILNKQSINFDCNSIINFTEAWSYFQNQNQTERIETKKHASPGIGRIRSTIYELMGTPEELKSSLVPERNLILSIAACPMNNDCTVHRRVLSSIYVFMTKNSTCSRYGSHWEEVGFQGQDPASDLRGVGMFGAIQMLYLSSSQETKELATDVFVLSRHPIHQFPLAVLSLNVTKMSLDAFRDGLLNRFCNKEDSAIAIVNRFYVAIMFRIYKKWSEGGMTIHDSCFLLKDVEKWCRAHPKKTFVKMNEYLGRNGSVVVSSKKKKKRKKNSNDSAGQNTLNLSWLDLTKPSLEVFI